MCNHHRQPDPYALNEDDLLPCATPGCPEGYAGHYLQTAKVPSIEVRMKWSIEDIAPRTPVETVIWMRNEWAIDLSRAAQNAVGLADPRLRHFQWVERGKNADKGTLVRRR